jgi:C-8 sterol isomerase
MVTHILDPEVLGAVAREVAQLDRAQMLDALVERLRGHYGDHIAPKPEWLFNLNGGATGAMAVFHASLSEYLVVFGTPLGTEGFSGRYSVDIHDWVLSGELWNMRVETPMERLVFGAGEHVELPRGEATAFRLTQDGWLLEYGRGNVVASLPHILGDAVFRGQDAITFFKTLESYGSRAIHELFGRRGDGDDD